MTDLLFGLVILFAFLFGLTNGLIDGGNLVSSVIVTRVLEPLPAILLVAVSEMAGLFLLGHQVANTLGRHMVNIPSFAPQAYVLPVLLAAVTGALAWNLLMWRLALPASSSHALLGGLAGAFVAQYGWYGVNWEVFGRVFVLLGFIPLVGGVLGFCLTRVSYGAGAYLTPAVSPFIRWLHIVTLAGIAMVHGSNDGQKILGIMALALIGAGSAAHLPWPWFLSAVAGAALSLGVLMGSRRMIRRMGKQLFRIQQLQSVSSQASTLALVGGSCLLGIPMSTTQVLSASVLGAGAALRPRSVRWDLAGTIGVGWLMTIPAAAFVSGGLVMGTRMIFHVVP